MQQLTLVFLLTEDRICLALKKRGFGVGYYNGYGGKMRPGETIVAAACRELHEEAEVAVDAAHLDKIAVHNFFYQDKGHLRVHTFFTRTWRGNPVETEEMQPEWFLYKDIPYEKMWEDDQHWLPRVLAGERLQGNVWFDTSGIKISKMEWYALDRV